MTENCYYSSALERVINVNLGVCSVGPLKLIICDKCVRHCLFSAVSQMSKEIIRPCFQRRLSGYDLFGCAFLS